MARRSVNKPSTKRTTMFSYIADKVPADAHFVLNKYSTYPKANNSRELEEQLKHFVNKHGANGLMALAEIHPDRELIESTCTSCAKKDKEIAEMGVVATNLKRDYAMSEPRYYNATGENGGNIDHDKLINKMTINSVVVGGFVLLGIALMLKK